MLGIGDSLEGRCSHYPHMWAIFVFLSVLGIGDPREGRGDVAIVPTCGPFLIFYPCSALVIPEKALVMLPLCPLVGHF